MLCNGKNAIAEKIFLIFLWQERKLKYNLYYNANTTTINTISTTTTTTTGSYNKNRKIKKYIYNNNHNNI